MSTSRRPIQGNLLEHVILLGTGGDAPAGVARRLAAQLDAGLLLGDNLHPARARAKMLAGASLSKQDYLRWIERISARLNQAPLPLVVVLRSLDPPHRETLGARTVGMLRFCQLTSDSEAQDPAVWELFDLSSEVSPAGETGDVGLSFVGRISFVGSGATASTVTCSARGSPRKRLDTSYPRLLKATVARPPEDVGGTWGYEEFLEAIADADHEQHGEMTRWAECTFNPNDPRTDRIEERLALLIRR